MLVLVSLLGKFYGTTLIPLEVVSNYLGLLMGTSMRSFIVLRNEEVGISFITVGLLTGLTGITWLIRGTLARSSLG